MNNELLALALLGVGSVLALIGFVWLVIRAFGVSTLWGILVFLFAPVGLLFTILHFKKAWLPVLMMLVGGGLSAVGPITTLVVGTTIQDTAQIESKAPTATAPAEERITLTGAKRDEYKILKSKKTFAVIQWANKDVTDADMEMLHGMTQLRELDLNSSQITDEGLHVLEDMPNLTSLRLAGTKITDDGFKEHIVPLKDLKELDLTGTAVKAATAREWKAAAPDRKLVR